VSMTKKSSDARGYPRIDQDFCLTAGIFFLSTHLSAPIVDALNSTWSLGANQVRMLSIPQRIIVGLDLRKIVWSARSLVV
jgi:hypothetical protein